MAKQFEIQNLLAVTLPNDVADGVTHNGAHHHECTQCIDVDATATRYDATQNHCRLTRENETEEHGSLRKDQGTNDHVHHRGIQMENVVENCCDQRLRCDDEADDDWHAKNEREEL